MGKYSIKELESLSGIKAHTLRIWEKRFNLLNPERTDTNIRYYSDQDLIKILNVSLLTTNGIRISEVVSFTDEELKKAVLEINDGETMNRKRINDLIVTMTKFDEARFHELFSSYVKELGFEQTFTDIIYPYLEKVGVLWLSGEIQATQEHLITGLIRGKLIAEIESLEQNNTDGRKAILFLPEGEFHELGLLFFSYLLKKDGVQVYYLGQSTPVAQTIDFVNTLKPNWVLTYSIVKSKKDIEQFLLDLSKSECDNVIYVENEHQSYLKLNYPDEVLRASNYQDILQFVN